MKRHTFFFLLSVFTACREEPGDLASLRNENRPADLRFNYYEMGDLVGSSTMRTRTVQTDDQGILFQYCSLDSIPSPICGEILLSADTSAGEVIEELHVYDDGKMVRQTNQWVFSGVRAFVLPDGIVSVYKFDSRQGITGCNSLYWTPDLGIIYWSNFIQTVSRKTEWIGKDEDNRKIELVVSHLKQELPFLRDCHFVDKSVMP